MVQELKKIPMALCGLILGIESLGNLFIMNGFFMTGNIIGIVGMILMLFVFAKLLFAYGSVHSEMMNPVTAGTLPTFTMALMLMAMYWYRWGMTRFASCLWLAAIIVHLGIMVAFCWFNLIQTKPRLQAVYPSWFVMFVGIGVIPVSAPMFSTIIGQLFFCLAVVLYVIVFPIVIFRLIRLREMTEGALPLLTIMAAPASLCLTGYLNIFSQFNHAFAIGMAIFAQCLYFATLFLMAKIYISAKHSLLRFYPSFAAFTFPLVIASTAITVLSNRLNLASGVMALAKIEWLAATLMIIYVFGHYLRFLMSLMKSTNDSN
ncbi:TDT family transporter [Weissella fangxianensis]|uniref:TDT family transporter n=1 Tax=Weissella fangxianensis TaxID=2953879 RepID=UPI0021583EAE|nr:TDT family transporter [Weissella fangxianensis]